SRQLWLSLILLFGIGMGMMVHFSAANTILQTIVDENKRGRVMSLYTMAVVGMAPFGSLMAGYSAGWFGTTETLLASGIICFLSAIIFLKALPEVRKEIRPIYRRLGILPPIAEGMQAATQFDVNPES